MTRPAPQHPATAPTEGASSSVDVPVRAAQALPSRQARHWRLGLALGAALALAACGGGAEVSDPGAAAGAPAGNNAAAPSTDSVTTPVTNPVTSPVAGASGPCGISDFQAQALARINQIRAQARTCGARGAFAAAGALAWNDTLERTATGHSTDMAQRNYFSHTSPEGQTMADRVTAAGYVWTAVAENIAAGQRDIAAAMSAWVASDGHCANLMGASYQDVALSCARDANGTPYWTMNLARPRG